MTAAPRARLELALSQLAALVEDRDRDTVEELSRRLREDVFRVLVAGEAKRGKSTLVNALLGRAVLPSGVLPLTAIATTLAYGDADEVLVRRQGREERPRLTDLATYVTETGNPGNEKGVVEVVVRVRAPLLAKGLELVDTPGTGSVYAHNTAAAAGARTRMDAAVLVLSTDPPISAAERQLLSELDEQAVAVFCVLNKADYLDVDGVSEARAFTEQVLFDATGRRNPVYALSAREALAARQAGDDRALAASGLPVFEEAFADFLSRRRDQALLQSLAGRARHLAAETAARDTASLRAMELNATDLTRILAAFEERVAEVDRQRREAHQLATGEVRRLIEETDVEAERTVVDNTPALLRAVGEHLNQSPERDLGRLELSAREVAAERIRGVLDDWRARRAAALDDQLAALDDRLARRLDDQIRRVRSAAEDLFALDLLDPPEPTRLTSAGRFRYAFADDPGTVDALAAAIRTRLPGSLGRRRVAAHMDERVAELMEKQVGRARSDFQSRLQDTARVLHRELDRRFEEGAGRLASAVRQAATLASRADAERIPAGARWEAHVAALTGIMVELDEVTDSPPSARPEQ